MATISTQDARGVFTKALIAVYKERTAPTAFLRSFFTTKEVGTLELSIEVQRGTEKIAVDVERGTEGNRNQFSKSSEKIFVPPYYKEYFDATELDFYDRLFTSNGTVDVVTFGQWMETVVEKLGMLQDKIERSYELQASQVLETGIVTLNSGDNIDFKRKATSLVALAGGALWSAGTSNPYTDLKNGATEIRTKGKSMGNIFNVILGDSAMSAFFNNTVVKERADIRRISLDAIRTPQKNSVGGVLHGEVSAGAYIFRLWTYPEYYDTEAATNLPYMNTNKVVIMPENPKFILGFAGVPQLLGKKADVGAGISAKRGAYLVGEYLDERNTSHVIEIKSAGIAIPVAVDQLYTAKVL
tara:strand:+ start:2823 stop:3890 length:1068 start_codon:yes stop_codon:yes gene_type:complete